MLEELAVRFDVREFVELAPSLPYLEALEEMLRADALLVLQASNCNQQIPAKLYEYLRAGRPVIGLTDSQGDTAATLRSCGVSTIAPLDSARAIAALLLELLAEIRNGSARLPEREMARRNSRTARAKELADLLDEVASKSRVR